MGRRVARSETASRPSLASSDRAKPNRQASPIAAPTLLARYDSCLLRILPGRERSQSTRESHHCPPPARRAAAGWAFALDRSVRGSRSSRSGACDNSCSLLQQSDPQSIGNLAPFEAEEARAWGQYAPSEPFDRSAIP